MSTVAPRPCPKLKARLDAATKNWADAVLARKLIAEKLATAQKAEADALAVKNDAEKAYRACQAGQTPDR